MFKSFLAFVRFYYLFTCFFDTLLTRQDIIKRTGEYVKENFTYPMNPDWTTDELIKVMGIWQAVERAYESKIDVDEFFDTYKEFKSVVKSIGEERQLGRDFEAISGYSLYRVVTVAKKKQTGIIKRKDLDNGK